MDLITRRAVAARLAFTAVALGLVERARRDDRGQGSVEYVGIIIVVVLIITAVVGFSDQIGNAIGTAISNAVDRINGVG